MRVPGFVVKYLKRKLVPLSQEVPDEIIGHNMRSRKSTGHKTPPTKPFLRRWFVIPKNRWLNIYLHQFVRDDEDRALHDHPWINLSILLVGSYIEHTIDKGGVHRRTTYSAGALKLRSPWAAHRVELERSIVRQDLDDNVSMLFMPTAAPSWSLFITGPVMRKKWGFHCPETGWRSSHDFHINGGCE